MWVWISLTSALTLALRDTFIKILSRDHPVLWVTALSQLVSGMLITAVFVLLYHQSPSVYFQPDVGWIWLILVPLDIAVFTLYFSALSISPLSICVPFLAFTPVLLPLTSWLILGESVTLWAFIGLVLVMLGAYVLFFKPGDDILAPFRNFRKEKGAVLMFLVSVVLSVAAVLDRMLAVKIGIVAVASYYPLLMGVGIMLFVLLSGQLKGRQLRLTHLPQWGGVILSGAVMVITHFLALGKIHAAYMMSVKRTSVLFSLLFAWLFFREKDMKQKLWGVLIMLGGVALVIFAGSTS